MKRFMHRRKWLAWAGGALGVAVGAGALLASWRSRAQAGRRSMRWPEGKAAPALSLPDLTGRTRTLAEFRGRVVVLNFWASWCPPCRAEMPSLQRMADFYEREGLQVVGVDMGETPERVRQYLSQAGLRFLTLLDADKSVAHSWGVWEMPSTVIIDAQGQPRHVLRGEVDFLSPEVAALIEPLLRPAPAKPSQA